MAFCVEYIHLIIETCRNISEGNKRVNIHKKRWVANETNATNVRTNVLVTKDIIFSHCKIFVAQEKRFHCGGFFTFRHTLSITSIIFLLSCLIISIKYRYMSTTELGSKTCTLLRNQGTETHAATVTNILRSLLRLHATVFGDYTKPLGQPCKEIYQNNNTGRALDLSCQSNHQSFLMKVMIET